MAIWVPRTTVAAIVEDAGRFLVVEELDEAGNRVINQPAGHLEQNETFESALLRELMEETGWEGIVDGLVGIYKWRPPSKTLTYIRYCFHAKPVRQHHEAPPDPDILGTRWMTAEEIFDGRARHRSPMVARCIRDYLEGSRHGLGMIHELD